MKKGVVVWFVLCLLCFAEAENVLVKTQLNPQILKIEQIGNKFQSIFKNQRMKMFNSLPFEKQNLLKSALGKLRSASPDLETQIGANIFAQVDWRGVQNKQSLMDQVLNFMGNPNPTTSEQPAEALSLQQSQQQDENNSFPVMFSSRGSINLKEPHSVSAAFLFYTAFLFFALAQNMFGSNPSASGMEAATPATIVRNSLMVTVSSKPPEFMFTGNSSIRNSCLSGNFFAGFAVAALILAFMFSGAARAKLFTTTLIGLGMAGFANDFQQQQQVAKIEQDDYNTK